MTTTAIKSICLRDHEARKLLTDGRVTLVRVVKPQPTPSEMYGYCTAFYHDSEYSREPGATMHGWPVENDRWWFADAAGPHAEYRCPFGGVGERLACKEKFWCKHDTDGDDYSTWDCGPSLDIGPEFHPGIQYCASPVAKTPPPNVAPHPIDEPGRWWLGPPDEWDGVSDYEETGVWEFLPWGEWYSTFSAVRLPRWASRLTIETAAVRVKQCRDVTDEEALAMGYTGDLPAHQGVWLWLGDVRRIGK